MEPGEKMGLGAMLLVGICCGGLPMLLVAGPTLAGVLSGSWPLLLAATAGGGLRVYHHRRKCWVSRTGEEAGG
ncbi:MAG: hypothetical protein HY558_05715 [Euryarchaeota archaeon]|nr:hypothetical protein [Euryarchaeota archaeon]